MTKFSDHVVTLRSSPTVFADTPIPASASTRILAGKPLRAMSSAARLLHLYRGIASSPICRGNTEQRDELATPIKKTRSHGTIAKRVGLTKRSKPAKHLPFSSSRVGRQRPVRNSFDHLVGADEQSGRHGKAETPCGLEVEEQLNPRGLLYRQLARLFAFENAGGVDASQTVSVGNAAAIARQTA